MTHTRDPAQHVRMEVRSRLVGPLRQEQHLPRRPGIGRIDPRRGGDDTRSPLDDLGRAGRRRPFGDDPHGFPTDDVTPGLPARHPKTVGLRDDLGGHDEDVTIGQGQTGRVQATHEETREIGPRFDLRYAVNRPHTQAIVDTRRVGIHIKLNPRSRVARAISAAACRSVMSNGPSWATTRGVAGAPPVAPTGPVAGRSAGVDRATRRGSRRTGPATDSGARFHADRRSGRRPRARAPAGPPTSGDTPTTGAAVPRRASRTPGTPRMIPIDTTGLLGGRITRSAHRIASSTPGAAAARSSPATTKRCAGVRVPAPPPTTPGSGSPDGLVRPARQPRASPPARPSSAAAG
jgi:hypothetical protein